MTRSTALAALVSLFCLSLPVTSYAALEIGKIAPDFTTSDFNGKPVKLSGLKGQIVVLEWTNPKCPFVRKHYGSGNMQKLQAYAHDKKVVWLSINSGAEGKEGYMTAADAKTFFEKTPLVADHYILDAKGDIGKLYGAKTTPHMFVIDKDGTLSYMGAIDSKPTPDADDIASADNYVRDAIDSLLAGKKPATTSTQSYGCFVKYAD